MHWTAQVGLICLISNFHFHLYLSGQYGWLLVYIGYLNNMVIGHVKSSRWWGDLSFYSIANRMTEAEKDQRGQRWKDKSEMTRDWDRFLRVFNTTLIFIFSNTRHETGMGDFGSLVGHCATRQPFTHFIGENCEKRVTKIYMWPTILLLTPPQTTYLKQSRHLSNKAEHYITYWDNLVPTDRLSRTAK